MSALATLQKGVKRLVGQRREEFKMLESMAEALAEGVDIEQEIARVKDARDMADASYRGSCAKLTQQRAYTESESAKLDAQLKDKQGETQDAMDQFDAQLQEKDMEYNNEIDALEASEENLKTSMAAELAEAKDKYHEEIVGYEESIAEYREAEAEAKVKMESAQEALKEFLSKHAE